jgi:hypothetical protein
MVCFGFHPSWSHHIINPIFKSSATSDPKNYGTIMTGHTFSKLYVVVLHMWLSNELEWWNLTPKGQAGFKWGYQTTNHIIKVLCCFVEFQKATNSIPR